MNNKKILKYQIISVVTSIILGTLLHFTFEWSGKNELIAIFSAINESVWEHLKLTFYPMLFFSIIGYFYLRKISNNYIEAQAIGIFSSIIFIITIFYTYTGILGTNFFIIDIIIFILSMIFGGYVEYNLMIIENQSTKISKILSCSIILFFLICFIIFTFNSPNVKLFQY